MKYWGNADVFVYQDTPYVRDKVDAESGMKYGEIPISKEVADFLKPYGHYFGESVDALTPTQTFLAQQGREELSPEVMAAQAMDAPAEKATSKSKS